jgi:hypothetical protein
VGSTLAVGKSNQIKMGSCGTQQRPRTGLASSPGRGGVKKKSSPNRCTSRLPFPASRRISTPLVQFLGSHQGLRYSPQTLCCLWISLCLGLSLSPPFSLFLNFPQEMACMAGRPSGSGRSRHEGLVSRAQKGPWSKTSLTHGFRFPVKKHRAHGYREHT